MKIFESGTTAVIISDKEINDFMKIIKSLEESVLLRALVKQLKMKYKNKKEAC